MFQKFQIMTLILSFFCFVSCSNNNEDIARIHEIEDEIINISVALSKSKQIVKESYLDLGSAEYQIILDDLQIGDNIISQIEDYYQSQSTDRVYYLQNKISVEIYGKSIEQMKQFEKSNRIAKDVPCYKKWKSQSLGCKVAGRTYGAFYQITCEAAALYEFAECIERIN